MKWGEGGEAEETGCERSPPHREVVTVHHRQGLTQKRLKKKNNKGTKMAAHSRSHPGQALLAEGDRASSPQQMQVAVGVPETLTQQHHPVVAQAVVNQVQ